MKTIAQFHENLLTAFVAAHVKIAGRIAGRQNGDTLEISIKAEKQGSRHCINSYCYSISPANKPHHMEIEEVWVGFDGEGYPWSDNMGGQIVDCTGKTVDAAIDLIVETLNKRLP